MTRRSSLFVMAAIVCMLPSGLAASPDSELFESKIRPIFAKNCYQCHTDSAQGGLRLDSREAALKGGKSGPAITPGKPDASLLIKAVSHTSDSLKMPPGGKLKSEEITALSEWVAAGAKWPDSTDFFSAKVRPILAKNCYACHTDSKLGDLRLDSRASILTGGKSGPALVPGKPD